MRELRKQIWHQSEAAIHEDLQSEAPEVADPQQATRLVVCDGKVLEGRLQPDENIGVRTTDLDMLETARQYARGGHRVVVLNMASRSKPGGG
eukprot:1665700-Alexandrium_andersonii.AAC.1